MSLLEVSKQSEAEAKVFLNETRRLARTGLRESDEVLQAEASWLERQEETITAETKVEITWLTLATKLQYEKKARVESPPQIENPTWDDNQTDADFITLAYQKRRDLLAAMETRDLNQKLSKSLRWNTLPQLTATGGYSLIGLDPKLSKSIDQIENSKIPGWNVGMALSHRFGQNTDRSELELAEAEHLAARSRYQSLTDHVEQDVQVSLKRFNRNRKLLDLSRQIETKKEKIYKAFKRKFSQGRISIQDLLRMEGELRRARHLRRIAESNLAIAHTNLLAAKGTFLESKDFENQTALDLMKGPAQ